MRSQLVFDAELKMQNRFLLASAMMKATRTLHANSTRTEDTVNKVWTVVANGTRMHGRLPKVTLPPAIDALLIAPAA